MLTAIPLLTLPVVAYNIIAFMTGAAWGDAVLAVDMVSGAQWVLSVGDLFMAVTLLLLFLEILKATRTGTGSILDHALSTLLFIICLVEFLIVPQAANSIFFLMTVVTLIDVIAGYSVTIRAARRDFSVDHYPPGAL